MEKIILFVISVFLFTLVTPVMEAPASYMPRHTSTIDVQINSEKLQLALELLDQHPHYKKYVEDKIHVIKRGKLTRIFPIDGRVTFFISDKYLEDQTIPWIASTLVHEARHVVQWFDGIPATDQQNELDAIAYQVPALYNMGGDVDLLISQNGLHFDSNGNGVLDPLDNWGY